MARAAVAAGADGLLVEVHPDPDRALSDGAQSLRPEQFQEMMRQIGIIATAVERSI
jgi:3-deoxy-7-phosphoheptulonate synthase